MTQTFTHTATYTYTRSELIADLVAGTFDQVLEKLGVEETVAVAAFEEVLKRGWLESLSVVAWTERLDGSSDWHFSLTVEIDARTHVARLAVEAERTIELEQERADDIADRLAYYGQMFAKVVQRHRKPGWKCGLWWTTSPLGRANRAEFNAITNTHPATSHRGATQRLGSYTPDEIDEATIALEAFADEE